MNKDQLNEWITKLGNAWASLNPDEAMALFDKDNIKYYETPYSPPVSTWEEVNALWKVIPENQKNVLFSHEIICCSDSAGVVNWKVSRDFIPSTEKQNIDGIFVIKLNEKGLCTYFKQWRMYNK